MLKPFKDWETFEKVIGIGGVALTVAGFIYVQLPFHAAFVVFAYLACVSFLLFYPWRFPNWPKSSGFDRKNSIYPIMIWIWWVGLVGSVLIVLAWSSTNLVWEKSPSWLTTRMQQAFIEQAPMISRDGVWDAKIVNTSLPTPQLLVGFTPVTPTSETRCVNAITAIRTAFGELSIYSGELRVVAYLVLFCTLILAFIERIPQIAPRARKKRP